MNKLVVITTPYFFADEASLIELLFAEGMSRLHLRKPDCKRDELEGLLIRSLRLITTGSFFMIGLPWQKKGL